MQLPASRGEPKPAPVMIDILEGRAACRKTYVSLRLGRFVLSHPSYQLHRENDMMLDDTISHLCLMTVSSVASCSTTL